MYINKLVGLNLDIFCGAYDAYDLLIFVVVLGIDWL